MNTIEWHNRFIQQAKWTISTRRYILSKLNIPIKKILEIGSGTDAVLNQFPLGNKSFTPSQLYGIDIYFPFLSFSNRRNPHLSHTCANAKNIPFASNTFDLTYCHYFLLWADNPLEILKEMRRVTKAGGYIIAFAEPDYGGRIDYPEKLTIIGDWQILALKRQGADPIIGRKIKGLFYKANLSEIKTGVIGAEWQPSDNTLDALEWQLVFHDVEDFISNDKLEYYKNLDLKSRLSGQRVLFVPTFYAIGKKQ